MYERSDSLRTLAEHVMEKSAVPAHLTPQEPRIEYLWCDKGKKNGKKTVYADTEKLTDKAKAVLGCDFIITFYRPACEGLTEHQMEILMEHELMHVGYEPETGKCRIVPHDVEDFAGIIEAHGVGWVLPQAEGGA